MNAYFLGLKGERIARKYLRAHGYRILRSRYRALGGEIDMICKKDDVLVMFEVKYRPQAQIGAGAAAVDQNKRRRVRRAAEHYMRKTCAQSITRFDILEITAAGVNHYPDAY